MNVCVSSPGTPRRGSERLQTILYYSNMCQGLGVPGRLVEPERARWAGTQGACGRLRGTGVQLRLAHGHCGTPHVEGAGPLDLPKHLKR